LALQKGDIGLRLCIVTKSAADPTTVRANAKTTAKDLLYEPRLDSRIVQSNLKAKVAANPREEQELYVPLLQSGQVGE
jgi:hypothetical protein